MNDTNEELLCKFHQRLNIGAGPTKLLNYLFLAKASCKIRLNRNEINVANSSVQKLSFIDLYQNLFKKC